MGLISRLKRLWALAADPEPSPLPPGSIVPLEIREFSRPRGMATVVPEPVPDPFPPEEPETDQKPD